MASKKEWFGEWFDSKYYHVLYKHRDHEEAGRFIDALCDLLNLKPGSKIMDLACGKGRHAIYLNRKGYDVTGLDLSERNIDLARHFQNESLRFFVHDMRNAWSQAEFDCVLNLFTSFGYFDHENENQIAIMAAAEALKPGGKFILDFLNPYNVINNLVEEEIKKVNGIDFHINKVFSEDDFIMKNISFEDKGEKYFFREKVKAIRRVKFLEYFENAGLKLIDIFGDYSLNKYEAEVSDRMIFYLTREPEGGGRTSGFY